MADRDGAIPSPARTFTVVLPAFNAEATIGRAIESVLTQTCPDWRLVIVNDGSTDETAAIARRFADSDARIALLDQANTGVAVARNNGVAASDTEFIVFLDADDELRPDYLISMDAFIRANPNYDFYHPNLTVVTPEGRLAPFSDESDPTSQGFEHLLKGCVIAFGGAVVRADFYRRLEGLRSGIRCEDYDFWLRATAQGGRALYNPEALYVYHQDVTGRRSEDAVAGVSGSIESLESLLAEGEYPAGMSSQIEAAIEDKKRLRVTAAREQELKGQAKRITASVERLLGPHAAKPVISVLRAAGRIARPWRLAAADRGLSAHPELADRRLKVLVIPSWYPSVASPTAGVFIREQVRALASHCDVAVLHVSAGEKHHGAEESIEDSVTVVRSTVATFGSRYPVGLRKAGLQAFETLRTSWGTPDIVHVQALWPAAIVARAIMRRFGIPYVVTEHSEEYLASSKRRLVRTPGVVRWLLRPLAGDASRIIAVSRFLADRLVELGLAVDPVVIPNVVPVSEPAPLPLAAPHVITHVSVMGPAKNLGMLLEAASGLRERRTDFVLRLVGEGECREDLERLAASLGLERTVQFLGQKSLTEVHQLLAESSFTVVSSSHETFSVSAAESLMCGRPVLSTCCGGPEEFVTPEVGRLIASGDVDAMTDGLDWMLHHFAEFDPMHLHEYARARFAPDVVAEQIIDVYKEVLACSTR